MPWNSAMIWSPPRPMVRPTTTTRARSTATNRLRWKGSPSSDLGARVNQASAPVPRASTEPRDRVVIALAARTAASIFQMRCPSRVEREKAKARAAKAASSRNSAVWLGLMKGPTGRPPEVGKWPKIWDSFAARWPSPMAKAKMPALAIIPGATKRRRWPLASTSAARATQSAAAALANSP